MQTGILSDCLMGSHILLARDGSHNYHNFLQMHSSRLLEMWPSVHIFTCGFNMMVLHHITDMKCITDCLKSIPDARMVMDVKLQFPGLDSYMNTLAFLCADLWKPRHMPLWLTKECRSGVQFKYRKLEIFNVCKFIFHAVLSCAFVNMEVVSNTSSKNWWVNKSCFVCFLLTHNLLNSVKYLRCDY
jgi:hypothetical protein